MLIMGAGIAHVFTACWVRLKWVAGIAHVFTACCVSHDVVFVQWGFSVFLKMKPERVYFCALFKVYV